MQLQRLVDVKGVLYGMAADIAINMQRFHAAFAIPADSFACAISCAIAQPHGVDINEIVFRPTRQES